MTTTTLAVRRINGHLGAEITDAFADEILGDDAVAAAMRTALLEHMVLVLPGLDPDPDQHVALARIFGDIELPEAYIPTVDGHPEICDFDSDRGYKADKWHADVMWRPTIPLGAVLCMRQQPDSGGDTIWTNCAAAYDALSENMKQYLDGATAHHSVTSELAADHPVVVRHPETGRRSLFVSELWTRRINDVPDKENAVVLGFLFDHLAQPEFCYRHRWSEGDVVIWDNRTTQHLAVNDYLTRRVVHRVGIKGTAPAA